MQFYYSAMKLFARLNAFYFFTCSNTKRRSSEKIFTHFYSRLCDSDRNFVPSCIFIIYILHVFKFISPWRFFAEFHETAEKIRSLCDNEDYWLFIHLLYIRINGRARLHCFKFSGKKFTLQALVTKRV